MLFNETKYTKWYFDIVKNAQQRAFLNDVYGELHHIVPKSLGGNNATENIVALTGREHFICHLLLMKMTSGAARVKMGYAVQRMLTGNQKQQRYLVTGRRYELLKKQIHESRKGERFTEERIEKLRASAQKRVANLTPEERQRRREIMIAINQARKGIKKPHQTGAGNYFYGKRLTGEANGFYGKTHSEESIELMRQAARERPPTMLGKNHSEDTKLAISLANRGRTHTVSEATKEKMSLALRGKPKSDHHKQAVKDSWARTRDRRIGENHPGFGKTPSPETIEKMRAAAVARWSDPQSRKVASESRKEIPAIPCTNCGRMIKGSWNLEQHQTKCSNEKEIRCHG